MSKLNSVIAELECFCFLNAGIKMIRIMNVTKVSNLSRFGKI